MTQNPLSTLKIDYWYKILPVIGAITLILGLTVDIKGVSNIFVQLISIGVIFIGIGEWINHPLQTKLTMGLKITSRNRINTLAGNAWNLIGIGLVIYALIYHR